MTEEKISGKLAGVIQLPQELLSKRAFLSTLACWYPEANLIFVNLDQVRRLKDQGPPVAMVLMLHELIHATEGGRKSGPWGRFSGVILNLSDLAFRSIEDILKSKDEAPERTKTRMLVREIAIDRLFLASKKVAEILAAYQFKNTSLPLFNKLQRSTELRMELDQFYEQMFHVRTAEFLKLYEKNIPREIILNATEKDWNRYKPTMVKNAIVTAKETFDRFVDESLRDSRIKALYTKLSRIGSLSASSELPIYLCRLALDVPIHDDVSEWVTGLPLQFDPERRLHILLDAAERLLKRSDSKTRQILARWIRQTRRSGFMSSSLDMELELDQIIGKESEVDFYDFFSPANPKNIHFNCEPKEQSKLFGETLGLKGPRDIRVFLRRGMEGGFRGKDPVNVLGLLQQWGFLPVVAYISNRRFRIKFSPRYDCRSWKIGWCLNYLKDQVVSSTDPSLLANPTSLGYFNIPEYLKKEIVRATRLAKKLADASVPESLMREFKNTSNRLGRTLQTE